VDGHPVLRTSIRALLRDNGFEVCGEAAALSDALPILASEHPDVCLIDVEADDAGAGGIRQIRDRSPNTAIVVLTESRDPGLVVGSIRAGASGFLSKGMDPARLPAALRGVLAGEASIPRDLGIHLVREVQGRADRRSTVSGVVLSQREWEVLDLMSAGSTVAGAGEALGLSPVTVRRHLSNAVRKLGVADRDAAIRMVAEVDTGSVEFGPD
jgi:DNA-binding NarL/FixJ family response regulator